MNSEALLVAAGQNLKRWLVATGWGRRHAPGGAVTLRCRGRRVGCPAGRPPPGRQ